MTELDATKYKIINIEYGRITPRIYLPDGTTQQTNNYSFSYKPNLINQAFSAHRYFLSWYNPDHARVLGPLAPKGAKGSYDRLDHKSPTTLKREVREKEVRNIDLHCYPNFQLEVDDWDNKKVKTNGKGIIVPKKYVEIVKYKKPDTIKQAAKYPDEYMIFGERVEMKNYYFVLDIDYKGKATPEERIMEYPPDDTKYPFYSDNFILDRAEALGAVAATVTSYGSYQILFKSRGVEDDGSESPLSFENPCVRALIALEMLGYKARDRFPHIDLLNSPEIPPTILRFLLAHGIDKSYLLKPCVQMIFRIPGSYNYKRSFCTRGEYYANPVAYDTNLLTLLYKTPAPTLAVWNTSTPSEVGSTPVAASAARNTSIPSEVGSTPATKVAGNTSIPSIPSAVPVTSTRNTSTPVASAARNTSIPSVLSTPSVAGVTSIPSVTSTRNTSTPVARNISAPSAVDVTSADAAVIKIKSIPSVITPEVADEVRKVIEESKQETAQERIRKNNYIEKIKKVIHYKKHREMWAEIFCKDESFLSSDTPTHGLSIERIALKYGLTIKSVSTQLKALVNHGYLITNGVWEHSLKKGRNIIIPQEGRTKRYCFGSKLEEFKVKRAYSIPDIPYERNKSRDGILRDIRRLDRLKIKEIVKVVWEKYKDYVKRCEPPEVRDIGDIQSMVDNWNGKKKQGEIPRWGSG
jgi:hypothetical protein